VRQGRLPKKLAFPKKGQRKPVQFMSTTATDPMVTAMCEAGLHYGYGKSRRHATIKPYIFGVKNGIEIIDLEKTKALLDEATKFARELGATGKRLLFVGTKHEARVAIYSAAESLGEPYVNNRWIGGTLTNFQEIKKRLLRLEDWKDKKAKGELAIYTKGEQREIDREVEDLERLFGGISDVRATPAAIFVVDPRHEHTAVREANRLKIQVIALSGTDCDISNVTYPIIANDSAKKSISFVVEAIAQAYREGRDSENAKPVAPAQADS